MKYQLAVLVMIFRSLCRGYTGITLSVVPSVTLCFQTKSPQVLAMKFHALKLLMA